MTHASPSPAACGELLRALPALASLRRHMSSITPHESRGWLGVLSALATHPSGLRIGQLADELRVDQSVASRQFARLEAAGLAERSRDPDDGRAHRLLLTDAGRAWLDSTISAYADRLAGALPGWTDAQVRELAALLDRLTGTMARSGTGRVPVDLADLPRKSGAST